MKTLLALTAFSLVLATTYALKCYVCEDSDSALIKNPKCGDTFDTENNADILTTCNATAGQVWCRKRKYGVNNLGTKIIRTCAAQCEDDKGAHLDRVTCCQKDGCNGVGNVQPALFALLATSLFSFVKLFA